MTWPGHSGRSCGRRCNPNPAGGGLICGLSPLPSSPSSSPLLSSPSKPFPPPPPLLSSSAACLACQGTCQFRGPPPGTPTCPQESGQVPPPRSLPSLPACSGPSRHGVLRAWKVYATHWGFDDEAGAPSSMTTSLPPHPSSLSPHSFPSSLLRSLPPPRLPPSSPCSSPSSFPPFLPPPGAGSSPRPLRLCTSSQMQALCIPPAPHRQRCRGRWDGPHGDRREAP